MSTDFTVECGSGPFVVRFWAVVLFFKSALCNLSHGSDLAFGWAGSLALSGLTSVLVLGYCVYPV